MDVLFIGNNERIFRHFYLMPPKLTFKGLLECMFPFFPLRFLSGANYGTLMQASRVNMTRRLHAQGSSGSASSKEERSPRGVCTCDGSLTQPKAPGTIRICARCGGRIIA
jgi:hypothetical protein